MKHSDFVVGKKYKHIHALDAETLILCIGHTSDGRAVCEWPPYQKVDIINHPEFWEEAREPREYWVSLRTKHAYEQPGSLPSDECVHVREVLL